jgi:hypothetical protein
MGTGSAMRCIWMMVALACCAKDDGGDTGFSAPDSVVSIRPELPTTADELQASARAISPLGDDWSMSYLWYQDGAATAHVGATLAASETQKGERWAVEVRATDVDGEGAPARSASVQILNTPPGIFSLETVPSMPRAGVADLVCEVAEDAIDADADALEYKMVWARNGSLFGGAGSTVWPGDTIDAASLVEGDTWRCTAQAFDGEAESPPAVVETVVGAVPAGFSPGSQPLSDADRWFIGHGDVDFFGYEVDAVGDVSGDGVDDLVVSGHRMEGGGRNMGRSFVMSGASLVTGTTTDPDDEAMWIVEGADYFDFSGYAVAGVGDTDGDGRSDLLVSSHNSDELAFNSGSVALFTATDLGDPGVLSAGDAQLRFVGESLRAYTGYSVASAGDVDADGWPDVLIGAMGNLDHAPYAGKAYLVRHAEYSGMSEVLLSETGTMLLGEHRRAYAGWAVAGAGDVDGDGLDDILVGACGTELGGADEDEDEGAAYLLTGDGLEGQTVMALEDGAARWIGTGRHHYVGYDVAGVGDVDGDGRPDIAVSALLGDMEGRYPGGVFLFVGDALPPSGDVAAAPVQFAAAGPDDQFGRRLSGQGDVDGDGRADVLIGAMTAGDAQQGMAVLWLSSDIGTSGTHEATDAYAVVNGDGPGSTLGAGLSIGGDYNGDGRADLAIGAHNASSEVGRPGALGVFFSR